MVDIKTGVFQDMDKCPLCELSIKECVCKETDYFDIKE